MKHFLLLISVSLLAVGALISCEEKKEPEKSIEITGGQTTQSVFADQKQAPAKVSFTTGGPWTSTIKGGTRAETWITITPSSGNAAGDYTITISLEPNYTGADRTATITITSGGKDVTITVTQKATTEDGVIPEDPDHPKDVAVTGVTLDKSTLSLVEGESETLAATVAPEDATNKNVEWTSSDAEVASVDSNGKVTALKAGSATITVETADGGKTATCAVTVTAKIIDVTGVSLNKSSLSLTEGDTETLVATVAPDDATNKNVEWTSSNAEVASVDSNGKVTALKAGSATITVETADGGKTATCAVTVTAKTISVTGVSLNKMAMSLVEGDTETLVATVAPEDATNKDVTWTSSDSAVASVDDNGKVTAVKAGSATITVTTADGGKTATCAVTVTAAPLVLTVDKTSIKADGIEAATFTVKKNGKDVTSEVQICLPSGVCLIGNIFTTTTPGSYEFYAYYTSDPENKSNRVTVTATSITVSVTGVTLDKTSLSLTEGDAETLIATVSPTNATNKNVTWTSNDSAVASVDAGGKVTALKAGTATITVTTADGGKTATCAVTITAKTIDVTGVSLNKTSLSLVEGDTETLIATVSPTNATNKDVTWSSSNSAVASVDADGKVTALKAGSATIIVSTVDGGKVATCNVTVSANPVGPGGDSDDWGNGGEIEL